MPEDVQLVLTCRADDESRLYEVCHWTPANRLNAYPPLGIVTYDALVDATAWEPMLTDLAHADVTCFGFIDGSRSPEHVLFVARDGALWTVAHIHTSPVVRLYSDGSIDAVQLQAARDYQQVIADVLAAFGLPPAPFHQPPPEEQP